MFVYLPVDIFIMYDPRTISHIFSYAFVSFGCRQVRKLISIQIYLRILMNTSNILLFALFR